MRSDEELVERALDGHVPSVSRLISRLESRGREGDPILRRLHAEGGGAHVIGVTGAAGSGKSTLVTALARELRRREKTVGIVAVDPSSSISGGSILGDRIRMQEHALDPGVFVRSMSTRGSLGGLSRATIDAVTVLDASGRDVVIIETVGVGQDEVDIIRTADVSIVTLVPGTGDEVQALKAGIMEIADIFVVNKADREGAARLVSSVESNLALHHYENGEWRPPIVKTVATTGQGIAELVETIAQFRAHSIGVQASRRKTRSEYRLRELVSQRFMDHLERQVLAPGELGAIVDRIAAREIDPYTAANDLLRRALGPA